MRVRQRPSSIPAPEGATSEGDSLLRSKLSGGDTLLRSKLSGGHALCYVVKCPGDNLLRGGRLLRDRSACSLAGPDCFAPSGI